jgi:hypothetical protein
MSTRPPPLENGYLWLAHTAMRSAQVRQLEAKLSPGIRYQMERRGISELGDVYDAAIEVWVHPDDFRPASAMLHEVVAAQ